MTQTEKLIRNYIADWVSMGPNPNNGCKVTVVAGSDPVSYRIEKNGEHLEFSFGELSESWKCDAILKWICDGIIDPAHIEMSPDRYLFQQYIEEWCDKGENPNNGYALTCLDSDSETYCIEHKVGEPLILPIAKHLELMMWVLRIAPVIRWKNFGDRLIGDGVYMVQSSGDGRWRSFTNIFVDWGMTYWEFKHDAIRHCQIHKQGNFNKLNAATASDN